MSKAPATTPVNQARLLRDPRFSWLFITQFLGVANDNLFKTALVVMIAYDLIDTSPLPGPVVVSLAAGLFILPFILFAPLSGQLADKYRKTDITLKIKAAEILIALAGIAALVSGSALLSMFVLFTFGAQSAFFTPCKYGLPPELLQNEELIAANGLLSSGTYIAVLLGSIFGALLATQPFGVAVISALMIAFAAFGYLSALKIPQSPAGKADFAVRYNPLPPITDSLREIGKQRAAILPSILGISWFYFIASTFHAQFPNFASDTLGVNPNTLAYFMILFSIGVGIGSMLNNRLLKAQISTRLVPVSIVATSLLTIDLYLASFQAVPPETLTTLPEFLSGFQGWRISFDLLFLSLMGGFYIVPLRAAIQSRTRPESRARIIAAGSMLDALCMLLSALIAAGLLGLGVKVIDLFLYLALATLASALYFRRLRDKPVTTETQA